MCRFALYLGPPASLGVVLTDPERSLAVQSRHSEEGRETANADGCGVAWWAAEGMRGPWLLRDAAPAYESEDWVQAGSHQQGLCILGHVRAATAGLPVTKDNCHPFLWGGLAFMHNGNLPDFKRLRPALWERLSPRARAQIQGTTDSEHAFGLFTDHWLALDDSDPLGRMACALRNTLATIEELRYACAIREQAFLNFAVADGRQAVVARCASPDGVSPHSLYVRRSGEEGPPASCSVTIASEPLDKTSTWEPVPEAHIVTVDAQRKVTLLATTVTRAAGPGHTIRGPASRSERRPRRAYG